MHHLGLWIYIKIEQNQEKQKANEHGIINGPMNVFDFLDHVLPILWPLITPGIKNICKIIHLVTISPLHLTNQTNLVPYGRNRNRKFGLNLHAGYRFWLVRDTVVHANNFFGKQLTSFMPVTVSNSLLANRIQTGYKHEVT